MNIVQLNHCDLAGRRFNGYDLHLSLNEIGHTAYQFVLEKMGKERSTLQLCDGNEYFVRGLLKILETQLSINNLVNPFGKFLSEHPVFQNADIVHYHLIHNRLISILDFPRLASEKPSVWTLHDPWAVTGNCIHPHECTEWETGCLNCRKLDDFTFSMRADKAAEMWKIKKAVYSEMDIDIVVSSSFMENYVRKSPLTSHFKHIHKIPFGIIVEEFQNYNRKKARYNWKIPNENFVITFRADPNEIKGSKYIIEMLNRLDTTIPVTVLTVGIETLPKSLARKYQVIELGWQNDNKILYNYYAASDVFLMPSLAESFGLMAIEAMASGCPVIVFNDTVLPEITFAPQCGIAVDYKDSDMLRTAVEHLIYNPEERLKRAESGIEIVRKHYDYKDYVNRHIALYQEILSRKKLAQ